MRVRKARLNERKRERKKEGDEVKHIRTTYVVMATAPPAAVHRCTVCAMLAFAH